MTINQTTIANEALARASKVFEAYGEEPEHVNELDVAALLDDLKAFCLDKGIAWPKCD